MRGKVTADAYSGRRCGGFARYGIALGGDSDARHVTSQLGWRVGVVVRV